MRLYRTMLVSCVVILSIAGLVFAATPVRVFVNGVDLGPAAQGHVVDGEVMIPLQAVAEALGAEVRWELVESCVYMTTAEAATEGTESAPPPAKTICVSRSGIPISLADAKARDTASVEATGKRRGPARLAWRWACDRVQGRVHVCRVRSRTSAR